MPDGSEGHGPCQLTDSSAQGAFSHNGIWSMGFGLEHQIKSTSGVGVNGDSESPEARGSNGFYFIYRRAISQETDRPQPKRAQAATIEEKPQPGLYQVTAVVPQANGCSIPSL